jgi:MFS superfamily sulfate permease-like transporter
VLLFNLAAFGVKTVGYVPAGLPQLAVPHVDPALLPALVADAARVALVSFSSLMLTARSFAAKNGYDIDPDQDFAALGTANIVSAVSQGFAVSGASRTAMSDAAGGRTHAVGLVAAAVVALVLLFFTAPLQYVPMAALGAVLIAAALSLIDLESLRLFYRIDRTEALLSVLATLGVVAVGAVDAILFAVALALLRFIRLISRPRVEVLGKVEGFPGFHSLARHEAGQSLPGLLLFRFNAPIIFFNAPYFKRELLRAVDDAGPGLRHVIIDTPGYQHRCNRAADRHRTWRGAQRERDRAQCRRPLDRVGPLGSRARLWRLRNRCFPDLAPGRARTIFASAATLISVKAASAEA